MSPCGASGFHATKVRTYVLIRVGLRERPAAWGGARYLNMRFIILAVCVVAVIAQRPPHGGDHHGGGDRPAWFQAIDQYLSVNDDVVDRYHEYRFEYHNDARGQHLMLAIDDLANEKSCHVVEIDNQWESLLNNTATIPMVSEEIYQLIHLSNTPETSLSVAQLSNAYGDHDATRECFGHKVFLLTYTPSAALMAMAV